MAQAKKESSSESKTKAESKNKTWAEQQHQYAQTAKEMFEKFSTSLKTPKPDYDVILKNHQKNLEALDHANKMAADVMKSISSLQSQFIKKTFEDMNALIQEFSKQKSGAKPDLKPHSDIFKNSIQRTMDHAKVVNGVLSDSGKEIHAKFTTRLDEAKEEFKHHHSKYSKH